MKKLLLILLCLPMIGFGQTDIPKKTNLITITNDNNIDDSFKMMGRLLINEGYELETADKTFHMITTKVKTMKCGFGCNVSVKYTIQFDELGDSTSIKISGRAYSGDVYKVMTGKKEENGFDKNSFIIENTGMKRSVAKESFNFMNNIAIKYEDSKLSYTIKQ